jgi:tRNA-dihydrouridine synthase
MVLAMHRFDTLRQTGRPVLVLAPLAALGHRGLREMIAGFGGCDLYFSEMISAEALLSGSNYENYYLDAGPAPDRLVYQLVGPDTGVLTRAAAALVALAGSRSQASGQPACAGIDLNMGCSAPEIIRQGSGVNWMTRPDEASGLVAAVRRLVPDHLSLSAKIRIGENPDFPALVRYCRGLQEAGLDFLTFHPRLRKDPWSRPAKWSWFQQLADELDLPLIANGDIRDSASLQTLADEWRREAPGGASVPAVRAPWPAGLMVGRAAVKTPWVFRDLAAYLDGAPVPPAVDLLETAVRFHQNLEAWQPRDFWLTRAKRFHAYYCQNLTFGHRLAARIQAIDEYEKILPYFAEYLEANPGERLAGRS